MRLILSAIILFAIFPVSAYAQTQGAGDANGANYNSDLLQALPLGDYRNFDQFALLAPGVFPVLDFSPAAGAQLLFSVNGRRPISNYFTIDGADDIDANLSARRRGQTSVGPQSVESLSEFQIATQLRNAEFGRNFGALVNAVSSSGSDEMHGTFYGFFTGDKLNARDFFDLSGGASRGKDESTRTQEGFVLGGPIVKSRTHYFFSFERQDTNATKETHFAVPDQRARGFNNGPFRSDIGNAVYALLPLPNNIMGPYGRNDFVQVLPADSEGTAFSAKINQKIGKSLFSAKYRFTDDESIIPSVGRAIASSIGTDARTQSLSLFFDTELSSSSLNRIGFAFGRTRFDFPMQPQSPFLFGESGQTIDLIKLASSISLFPLKGVYLKPLATPYGLFGPFGRTGPVGRLTVNPFSPMGVDPFNFPQGRTNNSFQFSETYTKNLASHSIKVGGEIKRDQSNSFLDRNFRPDLIYNGSLFLNPRFGPQLLFGSDNAAVGIASQLLQTLAIAPDSTIGLRSTEYHFFAQDHWKVNSRLTLDYGLRYEYYGVPNEVNRRIENAFDFKFPQPDPRISQSLFGRDLQPFLEDFLGNAFSEYKKFLADRHKIYFPDRNNFSPRLGLAFDITGDGKTPLRLGYGLYYDRIGGLAASQSRGVFPNFIPLVFDTGDPKVGGLGTFDLKGRVLLVPGSFLDFSLDDVNVILNMIKPDTLNTLGFDGGFLSYGLSSLLLFSGFQNPDRPTGGGLSFILPDAHLRSPYSQQWNVSVERQIGKDYKFSAAYIGSTGSKLLRIRMPNGGPTSFTVLRVNTSLQNGFQPEPFVPKRKNPSLGPYTVIESSSSSIFHSLQFSIEKRFGDGLHFGSSYSYGHAIDDASDLFDKDGSFGLAQNDDDLRSERASANFDIRHRSVTRFVYDSPLFKSSRLLGGFQLAGVLTLQTGRPFTVNLGFDANRDGNLNDRLRTSEVLKQVDRGEVRIDVPKLSSRALFLFLTPAAGLEGANGLMGRNVFRSLGAASLDLAVIKRFNISSRSNLQFRAEFFNLFNRTHFAEPVRIVESPSFGRSVSTALPARTIQFAVKFSF